MKKILVFLFLIVVSVKLYSQKKEANDCVNYIQVCDNSNITLTPQGIGNLQEIGPNVCAGQESNSLWLKIDIKTAGTLGFELIPTGKDITIDYDFWIFGPNATCDYLGTAIRCSTTNPAASRAPDNHTGMRDSEPADDFFEGPGQFGDNYIRSLDVLSGESYFIVIDRPVGENGFTLNWTGTAKLQNPFESKTFNTPKDIVVCNQNSQFDFSTLTSSILNNNRDFSVSYYENSDDANYKENEITGIADIVSKKYYYRIQSDKSECYNTGEIEVISQPLILDQPTLTVCGTNGTGTFNLKLANFTPLNVTSTIYYENRLLAEQQVSGTEIKTPENYTSLMKTIYAVVTTSDGCKGISELNLKLYPVIKFNTKTYNLKYCDDQLTGDIPINFSEITPQIIADLKGFTIQNYADAAHLNLLPNSWSFSQNTTAYVKAISPNSCDPVFTEINFEFGLKVKLIKNSLLKTVCDNALRGTATIDLKYYRAEFTTDSNVTLLFYNTIDDAKTSKNPVTSSQIISSEKTFYIRFQNGSDCPEIGEINIKFNQPKQSLTLRDITICPDASVILDAGSGFTDFLWSTGEKTQTILAKVGDYYVDLFSNGCVYRQNVKIIASETPKIDNITVSGNTVTINVSGGTMPYYYSIDGLNYQESNTFKNVKRSVQTAYVKSVDDCEVLTKQFLIVNLVNTITPNGDGKNDVLDYSDLKIKSDVSLEIFNRDGKSVFKNEGKNYIWDGKNNNRNLPTGNYWYILKWTEPDTNIPVVYSNWILLKNR